LQKTGNITDVQAEAFAKLNGDFDAFGIQLYTQTRGSALKGVTAKGKDGKPLVDSEGKELTFSSPVEFTPATLKEKLKDLQTKLTDFETKHLAAGK
jgi:hypothetical protein